MQYCQAPGCFNSSKTDGAMSVTIHIERHGIWAAVLGKPERQSILCSSHFEESCFVYRGSQRMLKKGSIPTLNLPVSAIEPDVTIKKEGSVTTVQTHNSCDSAEIDKLKLPVNSAELKDFRLIKNQRYCQAPGCYYRSTSTTLSVHENRNGTWSALLGKTEKTCMLCSRHFEESCFTYCGGQRRLATGAIPTLNMPVTLSEPDITIKKEYPSTQALIENMPNKNSWKRKSDEMDLPVNSTEPKDVKVIKKRRCQAPGCANRYTTTGETVHINRRGTWSAMLGKTEQICILCNRHFKKSCFIIRNGQRLLKKKSVPTLNMLVIPSKPDATIKKKYPSTQALIENISNSWKRESDEMDLPVNSTEVKDDKVIENRRCQAPGCFNRFTTTETVHINRRGTWSAMFGKIEQKCVLCNRHFEDSCFITRNGQRVLKRGSVPTLNMLVIPPEADVTIKNEDPFGTGNTLPLHGDPRNSWAPEYTKVECDIDIDLHESVIKLEDKWADAYESSNI